MAERYTVMRHSLLPLLFVGVVTLIVGVTISSIPVSNTPLGPGVVLSTSAEHVLAVKMPGGGMVSVPGTSEVGELVFVDSRENVFGYVVEHVLGDAEVGYGE